VLEQLMRWEDAGAEHFSMTLIAGVNAGDLGMLAERVLGAWR
jgi:hypothetical protein